MFGTKNKTFLLCSSVYCVLFAGSERSFCGRSDRCPQDNQVHDGKKLVCVRIKDLWWMCKHIRSRFPSLTEKMKKSFILGVLFVLAQLLKIGFSDSKYNNDQQLYRKLNKSCACLLACLIPGIET